MVFYMASRRSLFSFTVSLFLLESFAEAKCYNYDGTESGASFKACNGTAQSSMCCRLGATTNDGETCGLGSSYGLCGGTGMQLWRESCTDPTWKSPSCLKLCVSGAGASNYSVITACGDGSFCCGKNNATCCSAGNGLFIINNQLSNTLQTMTLSLPSTAPSASTKSPILVSTRKSESTQSFTVSTTTPTPPSVTIVNGSSTTVAVVVRGQNGLSKGGKVGLSIGIPILVLAIFGVAFYFLRRYWQRKLHQYKGKNEQSGDSTKTLPVDSSRPTTGYTGAEEPTSGKAGFVREEPPEIPAYIAAEAISSCGPDLFGNDFFKNSWSSEDGEKKQESYQMETYAIELDDGVAHPDRIFPINPHAVEMDAHEPKADNDGLFEMSAKKEEEEEYLGLVELFKEAKPRNEIPDEKIPVQVEVEEKIVNQGLNDPQNRESEGKIFHERTGEEQQVEIMSEKITLQMEIEEKIANPGYQDPKNKETEGKIFHEGMRDPMRREEEEKQTILSIPTSQTGHNFEFKRSSTIETDRLRHKAFPSVDIPKSQFFSPAVSPTRASTISYKDAISLLSLTSPSTPTTTEIFQPSPITPMDSLAKRTNNSHAHISSLVMDASTRIITRPRKKSNSSIKSGKSIGSNPVILEDREFLELLKSVKSVTNPLIDEDRDFLEVLRGLDTRDAGQGGEANKEEPGEEKSKGKGKGKGKEREQQEDESPERRAEIEADARRKEKGKMKEITSDSNQLESNKGPSSPIIHVSESTPDASKSHPT